MSVHFSSQIKYLLLIIIPCLSVRDFTKVTVFHCYPKIKLNLYSQQQLSRSACGRSWCFHIQCELEGRVVAQAQISTRCFNIYCNMGYLIFNNGKNPRTLQSCTSHKRSSHTRTHTHLQSKIYHQNLAIIFCKFLLRMRELVYFIFKCS